MRALLILLTMTSIHAGANTPSVTANPGGPYRFTFSDGREAMVKVTHVDSPVWKPRVKIVDNTCVTRQNMSCTNEFQVRRFWISLVWTKHPQAEMIGQVVKRAFGDQSDLFEIDDPVSANLPIGPRGALDPSLIPQTLRCDDFSWLPTGTREAPAALRVIRWDGEDSSTNPETGLTENRTVSGALNVTLERRDPRRLSVTRVQAVTGNMRQAPLMMVDPSISLTFLNAAGETCQVGISTQVAQLMGAYVDLVKQRSPLVDVPPAIVGQEYYLRQATVAAGIEQWTLQSEENFK